MWKKGMEARRLVFGAVLAALLAAGWLCLPGAGGQTKGPTIKEIMRKAHKGDGSLLLRLDRDLKADAPNWSEIQNMSTELAVLGGELAKNKPAKGDQASWDKLTRQYLDQTRTLQAAAMKKDARAAVAAHMTLTRMCQTCHSAHK
jgi:hypothetical protein